MLNHMVLKINEAKTEVIAFAPDNLKFVEDEVTIHDANVPFVSKGCCLVYLWHRSLLSVSAVEENISKTRKAFFNCGCLGVFQGNLNPLTSRSIYLTCVIPVLLYGCENWILNDQLILDLECFQAWAGKKILGLTKHRSNTIVPIALDLPFIQAHILIRKLKGNISWQDFIFYSCSKRHLQYLCYFTMFIFRGIPRNKLYYLLSGRCLLLKYTLL